MSINGPKHKLSDSKKSFGKRIALLLITFILSGGLIAWLQYCDEHKCEERKDAVGYIKWKGEDDPIPNAHIVVLDSFRNTSQSDEDGEYRLKNITRRSSLKLQVTHQGAIKDTVVFSLNFCNDESPLSLPVLYLTEKVRPGPGPEPLAPPPISCENVLKLMNDAQFLEANGQKAAAGRRMAEAAELIGTQSQLLRTARRLLENKKWDESLEKYEQLINNYLTTKCRDQ